MNMNVKFVHQGITANPFEQEPIFALEMKRASSSMTPRGRRTVCHVHRVLLPREVFNQCLIVSRAQGI